MDNVIELPPHNEEVERAIIGAVLINNEVFYELLEIVNEEDFYIPAHQLIWRGMTALSINHEPIDNLTVCDILTELQLLKRVGGMTKIAELTCEIASAANAKHHARMIREYSILRSLRTIGSELRDHATEQRPASEVALEAEQRLFATMWSRQTRPWKFNVEVMDEALTVSDRAQQRGSAVQGITTGLAVLDRMLSGWQPSDLVIIAARTSMGKTALACGAAVEAARSGAAVAIVSLEMSSAKLGVRLLAYEANVSVFNILTGNLHADEIARVRQAAAVLSPLPIAYEDSGTLSIDQLRAKVRQLRVRGQLDILFVDYLQLMHSGQKTNNRQVEISEISRGLKLLAKEMNITVVALSQCSRECEKRDDKRPILSDLRESGAIEQDADVVMFLYRDEVYDNQSPEIGTAEVLIRKHRNGPIGDVRVAFRNDSARFADL